MIIRGTAITGPYKTVLLLVFLIWLAGCTSIKPQKGFDEVKKSVSERIGQQVYWKTGGAEDRQVDEQVMRLLQGQMSLDEVIQVALLNNPDLQATYENLGIAQASLVQAGLLSNPVFSGALRFVGGGESPTLDIDVSQDFLSILTLPIRRKLAHFEFEAAKLRLTATVIDLVSDVRRSYYNAQANEQAGEMMRQVVAATAAMLTAAGKLHDAGNINDLALDRQQAIHEEARLLLADVETALMMDRERLNILMGLWGKDVGWKISERLPEVPEAYFDIQNIEKHVLEKSLDLATARLRIEGLTKRLGLTKATSFIPDLELGYSGERDDGIWGNGPAISLQIPVFDTGQARRFRVGSELRKARWQYMAMAVDLRAASRRAVIDLRQSRTKVDHLSKVLLPLRQRIIEGAMLEFNAMQVGVFRLLADQRRQIETGRDYISALREYWFSRTKLEQLLSGSLTTSSQERQGKAAMQSGMSEESRGH